MSDRKTEILEASAASFARYGLQKTTMSDIAATANVSRQTLYNLYPNREVMLHETITFLMAKALAEIQAEWAKLTDFGDKLDVYFQLGAIAWYDAVEVAPDSAEMLDGMHEVIMPAFKASKDKWVGALTAELEKSTDAQKAAELADFIFISAKNAKYYADSRDHMIARLALLKEMVLTTL
ncbi:MAG: TetR/AcrR family transcriptional regulator [Pseudomonadota bacterium]